MEADDIDILTLSRMLRIAGREVRKRKDENATTLGMTSTQADALTYIIANPGCKIADLREPMGTSHQAACGIVDRMREKGLVEISTSDRDARVRVIKATPEGHSTYEKFMDMGCVSNSSLMANISEDERRELYLILSKILSELNGRI